MARKILILSALLGAGALAPTIAITSTAASAQSSASPLGVWEIGPWVRGKNYSIGMQQAPRVAQDGSLIIDFPLARSGEWDALTTKVSRLDRVNQVTIKYRIKADPRARFVAVERPEEPAAVSFYFQRAGDTWTAKGKYVSYRWYSPPSGVIPLEPGEHTVTLNLNDRWTNVYGKPSTDFPADFYAAKRKASRFGLAFGSISARSHGVYATAPARFTLLSVEYQ